MSRGSGLEGPGPGRGGLGPGPGLGGCYFSDVLEGGWGLVQ